ncbi:CBU_0592 family membrane protein [Ferruginibacter sp.]
MNYNDIIGTIGVGLILLAYFCNTFGWINNKSKQFFLLNIIGAGLACYASLLINYWPFVILEGTWFLVSVIGLLQKAK